MKTFVDFIQAGLIGMEDGNTQEGQLEISPVVSNREDTETIVDRIGDNCEVGADDSVSANPNFIDPELEADIRAIEEGTAGEELFGDEILRDPEDPYNEVPGGADMSNDNDDVVNDLDKVVEYSTAVNKATVTGTQSNVDEVMREQYDQDEDDVDDYAGSITGPADNQADITGGVDISESEPAETLGDDEELSETNDSAIDGDVEDYDDYDEDMDLSDVLGTESENFDIDEEDEPEEEIEDAPEDGEEELPVDEDGGDVEEAGEEIPEEDVEVEDVPDEDVEDVEVDDAEDIDEDVDAVEVDDVEVGEDEALDIPEDTNCGEEYEMLGSINVKIQTDESLSEAKQEEIQSKADNVTLGSNSAFANVSEMRDVNGVDGEVKEFDEEAVPGDDDASTQIGDGSNMSDVVGEMLADQSHGDEDGYEEGDVSADGEGEYSEGEASYDDLDDTTEHDADVEVDDVEVDDADAEDMDSEDYVPEDTDDVDAGDESDEVYDESESDSEDDDDYSDVIEY